MTPIERAVQVWEGWDGRRSFVAVVAEAIHQAVLAERERCAKVAEAWRVEIPDNLTASDGVYAVVTGEEIAEQIRAGAP